MLKLFSIFSKKKEVTPVRPVKRERVVTTADRDAAVEAVAALNGEEEILAFLAECKYADARYAAAQRITSDEGLEKLKTLTRNSDRRVYKWASAELDRRKDSVSKLEKAKALVSEAVALVKAETLTPNRVAEIERAWDTFTDKAQDVETAIVSKFKEARQSLHDRLAAQIDLQLKLKTSIADAENTELDETAEPSVHAKVVSALKEKLNSFVTSAERASLPANLIGAFEDAIAKVSARAESLAADYRAVSEREEWLNAKEAEGIAPGSIRSLRDAWRNLPNVKNPVLYARLQSRFDQIVAATVPEETEASVEDLQSRFFIHFDAMRKALEAGAVTEAAEHDAVLSRMNLVKIGIEKEQRNEYAQLAQECRRLSGWDKWRSNMELDALISRAKDLPEENLTVAEIAKAVAGLRQEWKNVNARANMASREKWLMFDAACNEAYRPVLEQANAQAEVKKDNIAKAEALLIDAAAGVKTFEEKFHTIENFDWRETINFYRKTVKAWHALGILGTREKRRLDEAFNGIMAPLKEKLGRRTNVEIEKRKALIEEASKIDTEKKDASSLLRACQQRWQECAKAFPLDNKEDSRLWRAFSEVCEGIHNRRMEKQRALEGVYQTNLAKKEDIIRRMEAAVAGSGEDLSAVLSECTSEFKSAGNVPKRSLDAINKRFADATDSLRDAIYAAKHAEIVESLKPLAGKLSLIADMENAFAASMEGTAEFDDGVYEQAWGKLPELPAQLEEQLSARFFNGLKAAANRNAAYVRRLENNTADLRDGLLLNEILFSVPTPAKYEEARTKKQLEVLQSSLSGAERPDGMSVFKAVAAMPALLEREDIDRICRLVPQLIDKK